MPKGNPNPSESTRFRPGQSGNPGGRPKESREVKDLARQYGPAAIKLLAGIMNNEKAHARDRMEAARALLDRGYGRPTQPIAGDDEQPLQILIRDLARERSGT